MNKILSSYEQEVSSYMTIHEFWEKFVPCWDTVRYDIPSPKGFANKLRSFISTYLDNDGNGKEEYIYFSQGSKYSPKVLELTYEKYKENYVSYKSFRKEFQGITSGAPKDKPLQYFLDTWPEARGNFFYFAKKRTGYLDELTKADFKAQELLKDYLCCPYPFISAMVSGSISDAINESFRLKWFELDFFQSDKGTNIIWSKSNYVSLPSLYNVLLSSNETPENIMQEIKKFEDLIYYRPVLGNGEGHLEFDLYFSYQTSKEICSKFELRSLPNPERDCVNCEYCSKGKVGTELLNSLKDEIIKLFKDEQRTFGMHDILNELKKLQYPFCNSDKVYPIIKALREKGDIKIVDFESSCKMLPIYQSIKGPLPPAKFIEENSEQYKKMDLISIRDFCKGNYREYQTLLTLVRARNLPEFIARKRNGFSRVHRVEDLINLRALLKEAVPQCNESKERQKVKKVLKTEKDPLYPLKPNVNYASKTINIFGFEITWRKKEETANANTDLIEF